MADTKDNHTNEQIHKKQEIRKNLHRVQKTTEMHWHFSKDLIGLSATLVPWMNHRMGSKLKASESSNWSANRTPTYELHVNTTCNLMSAQPRNQYDPCERPLSYRFCSWTGIKALKVKDHKCMAWKVTDPRSVCMDWKCLERIWRWKQHIQQCRGLRGINESCIGQFVDSEGSWGWMTMKGRRAEDQLWVTISAGRWPESPKLYSTTRPLGRMMMCVMLPWASAMRSQASGWIWRALKESIMGITKSLL